MSALRCPYCKHVWGPRVTSPKACPKCKRFFTKLEAEKLDVEVMQEWIVKPFKADVAEIKHIAPCDTCSDRNQPHEGIYIWLDGKPKYCLTHLIEEIAGFDKAATYRDSDGIGSKALMRDEIQSILHEALAMCEEILTREEF